jgi:hypothetical protein
MPWQYQYSCMGVTITVSEATYQKLISFRGSSDETEDDIIADLLEMATDTDEDIDEETDRMIRHGLKDVKAGRHRPLNDIAKEMGI